MLTQAELGRELNLSRATIHRSVELGMPLSSIEEAKTWRLCRVRPRMNPQAYLAQILPPTPAAPEPMVNGKFTPAASLEIVEFLRELKAGGATRHKHRQHQTFCDGVR